jgi:protein TonB
METKKNPKVDLNKDSSLYFVIGLALTLLVSWQAIEWKTYDKDLYGYEALNVVQEDIEEIPRSIQLKTPPRHRSVWLPKTLK